MMHGNHYARLALMTAASFAAMYVLMYAMVDGFANVYGNLNQVYMAGLMAAAMVIIELAVMWGMYENRRLNVAILILSAGVLAACGLAIREQATIGNTQFLRSMIPHHAAAILMCQEAPITEPAIKQLCRGIVESQTSEIKQMKELLAKGGP
jgi:uncharacterized protein (DUF305 family)